MGGGGFTQSTGGINAVGKMENNTPPGSPGSVPGPVLGGGNPGTGSGHPLQDLIARLGQNSPGDHGAMLQQILQQWQSNHPDALGGQWQHPGSGLGSQYGYGNGQQGNPQTPGPSNQPGPGNGSHVPVDPRIQRLKSKLQ